MGLIVSKFGGTSMADSQAMLRSSTVAAQNQSSVMVVSATSETTNQLISLIDNALNLSWNEFSENIRDVETRHMRIAEELNAPEQVFMEIQELCLNLESLIRGIHLLKDCSSKARDRVLSIGEKLSSNLCTVALQNIFDDKQLKKKAVFFDVTKVMRTDDQHSKAAPQFDTIKRLASEYIAELGNGDVTFVTQGFIGQSQEGQTTTLGRGGSDYSAAILAEAFNAERLEIWTDVAGIATTDPRLYSNTKQIKEITFKEASELASFGAKILHPTTIAPCQRNNIPVYVGSSFDPDQNGTWIVNETTDNPLVRGIALKKDQVLLTISNPEMLYAHGFLFQIFEVFNRHRVSVDSITTSEISIALTLDNNQQVNRKLIRDLEEFARVKIEEPLSMVSIIGNRINYTPGFTKELFSSLEDIQVRMICSGASKHNFCFLVNEQDGPKAVAQIHEKFLG